MGFLKKYFIAYGIVVLLLVVFLKWHKEKSFSNDLLTQMLTAQSRSKYRTDDPCLYTLAGEPEVAGQYLKLTFLCPGKEARFSLDYRAIVKKTVGGAIEELFRLNGVTLDSSKLKCKQGGREVSLTDPIVNQDNIECLVL
ncbi:MAG: hypothetical protein A3D59_01000 [Candidatus Wildermuthbacteria bacterium RIFCSPHIGHO2_02_FULL_47_17]|uniref:Uncharacterized protein n=1 Tax=Candidatus Wildermuthbacteria bacterium RIFCSPHIGHO2_02_FULL_47_17 TaxID=1802452 RepID=A0A1G2R906_9BACT|nr:MAG: hypothetical protein A3D59_01000 [Candidatus Wildermuthbacteria bacterium RIFCSPHIGHO2_02_FULL_47_17]